MAGSAVTATKQAPRQLAGVSPLSSPAATPGVGVGQHTCCQKPSLHRPSAFGSDLRSARHRAQAPRVHPVFPLAHAANRDLASRASGPFLCGVCPGSRALFRSPKRSNPDRSHLCPHPVATSTALLLHPSCLLAVPLHCTMLAACFRGKGGRVSRLCNRQKSACTRAAGSSKGRGAWQGSCSAQPRPTACASLPAWVPLAACDGVGWPLAPDPTGSSCCLHLPCPLLKNY